MRSRKPPTGIDASSAILDSSFNEAGSVRSRKHDDMRSVMQCPAVASMRPAL